MNKKKKIIYIAGTSRCGSTILGNILGSIPNFFHVGEARFVWDRGLNDNWLCSCGKPFFECLFWKKIIHTAFGYDETEYQKLMKNINHSKILRFRETVFNSPQKNREKVSNLYQRHIQILNQLYSTIYIKSNCNVIVDSSASPLYAYLLNDFQNTELYVIHLVRDIRAIVYSRQHRRHKQPSSMNSYTTMGKGLNLKSICLDWIIRNKQINSLIKQKKCKSMVIRYEDFCSSPQKYTKNIINWVKEGTDSLPFISEYDVLLKPNHAFSGNPIRFNNGITSIQCDQKWKANLSLREQFFALAIGLPLMLKYHYILPNTTP